MAQLKIELNLEEYHELTEALEKSISNMKLLERELCIASHVYARRRFVVQELLERIRAFHIY